MKKSRTKKNKKKKKKKEEIWADRPQIQRWSALDSTYETNKTTEFQAIKKKKKKEIFERTAGRDYYYLAKSERVWEDARNQRDDGVGWGGVSEKRREILTRVCGVRGARIGKLKRRIRRWWRRQGWLKVVSKLLPLNFNK